MIGDSVARRLAWSLFALSAGVLVLALRAPGATGAFGLGTAVAATAAVAALARLRPGPRRTDWRVQAGMFLPAVIAWAWVACVASLHATGAVLAAVLAAGLQAAFGGSGRSPFHPAAAGAAAVLLFAPTSPPIAPDTMASLAFAAGALLMLWRGLAASASLLGWFGGLGAGALLAGQGGLPAAEWLSPAHLLVGGFVLADGGSAGLRTASRASCGIAAGVMAMALPGPAALPCAVLLANLLVPAIEGALSTRMRA